MIALLLPLALALTAQDAAPSPRDDSAERLEAMKTAVKSYEFARDAGPLKLQPDPAFRLGRQATNVLEGAIFLWIDEVGRPEAAAQVFLHRVAGAPDGIWNHEFTSLSSGTFVANHGVAAVWRPGAPGVEFRPVPDAPKPASSPASRLRQMKAMAGEFRAEDDFGDEGNIITLRLLTTPVARYGKAGAVPEDGALFAFVEGTDPEVFVFLEVRPGADGPEWQYACAPMSCWPLKVTHKGRVVWDVPRRPTDNPTLPFYNREYRR